MILEKPAKRGPKPRKRIKRGGTIARKSRPRKKRKSVRARLIEKADELCRAIVRKRGACEECGSTLNLQWSHGYGRRFLKTRWSTWGTFLLCRGCHFYYGKHWEEWVDWMRRKLGAGVLEELHFTALDTRPLTNQEIEAIISDLERALAVENCEVKGGANGAA